jgi:hypothetical protein
VPVAPASTVAPTVSAITAQAPTVTPRPAVPATPAAAPAAERQALPTVETIAAQRGPGFLTPVELELELQQPLTDLAELHRLVDGMQALDGIATVRSDGLSVHLRYDSTRVLPARIRERLSELGHPARSGTEVQNPGEAAD